MLIARAASVMLLLLMFKSPDVAPAPIVAETEVTADGEVVLLTVDAPGPANIPKVVFSLALVLVADEMFRPVALPRIFRFLTTTLSVDVITEAAKARRTTEVNVVVLAAEFCKVRSRWTPAVPGLSPSIVTLLAPFNSMSPRPVGVAPLIVILSAVGRTRIDV